MLIFILYLLKLTSRLFLKVLFLIARNVKLTKNFRNVEKVENSINILPQNETRAIIKNKCDNFISKNTVLKLLLVISKIIQGKNINFNDF